MDIKVDQHTVFLEFFSIILFLFVSYIMNIINKQDVVDSEHRTYSPNVISTIVCKLFKLLLWIDGSSVLNILYHYISSYMGFIN